MTLPREVFETRKSICRGCGAPFKETLDGPGKPATYCRRCRKDYELYPRAMRRQRQRVKLKGQEVSAAHRQAVNEIRDRLLGKREDEP